MTVIDVKTWRIKTICFHALMARGDCCLQQACKVSLQKCCGI